MAARDNLSLTPFTTRGVAVFETYGEIFDKRGDSYHRAMRTWPAARDEEFLATVELAAPAAGDVVLDVPSGGGYLHRYLPRSTKVIGVETSRGFLAAAKCDGTARSPRLLCAGIGRLPLPDGTAEHGVDVLVNLAGLHHEADQPAFFREAKRVLRPGGTFCLADVRAGSTVDRFLNGFVDQHNSMGHRGCFLDDSIGDEISAAGFDAVEVAAKAYRWRFPREADIGTYCKLMFGIDRASDGEVQAAVSDILGCGTDGELWWLDWELLFVRATKPPR